MRSSGAIGSILIVSLVLATGVVAPAAAVIIQVPSAHSTIQAGINAAVSGDTVQVGPGTYTGASNRDLDFGGKSILLRSSAGAATTIIDCQNLGRGIRFHTGETAAAIVQGFTIRNGLASGTLGGGILIETGASPTIRNCRFIANHANTGGGLCTSSSVTLTDCVFEDNSADNWGGGVYGEAANLQMTRCTFTRNEAGFGAGVHVRSGATLSLLDCTFTENDPGNQGGGVYAFASSVTMNRCSFVRNTAQNGAGAYLLEGTASVDSCTFTSNTATYGGGGMQAKTVEAFTLTGSLFEDNVTATAAGNFDRGGGGLRCTGSGSIIVVPPVISDCVFTRNQALGSNGANGGGMVAATNSLVERCVFTDNHADGVGGGAGGSAGRVHDCVFEGNTALNAAGLDGGSEIVDCRFTDNHAQQYGGGCQPGSGNVVCSVIRCEFSGNSAGIRGGGMDCPNQFTPWVFEDSHFFDNAAFNSAGAYVYCGRATSIAGCTFAGNVAGLGGGAVGLGGPAVPPPVSISGSTLVGNGAQIGSGLSLTIPVEIVNTIIAFGIQGEGVVCSGNGIGVMSCTDIFGNAGGDWTACIADQVGINGNFSLDPRFCNVGARDYTLAQTSPCTAANAPAGCGLIGAHPVGCASPIGIADAGAPAVTPTLRVTPNPVRGSGVIEWSGVGERGGGGAGAAELRLYDAGGRLVARHMGSGESGAGAAAERLSWSALVGSKSVPSGVYFLQLGKDERTAATVRLVVIR